MTFTLADTGLADLDQWLDDPWIWITLLWPAGLYFAVLLLFWFLFWCPFVSGREPSFPRILAALSPGLAWCGLIGFLCTCHFLARHLF